MTELPTPAPKPEMRRRAFLKTAGAAVGAVFLPPSLRRPFLPPGETEPAGVPWRFFEDLEGFNPDVSLPEIKSQLAAFGSDFGQELQPFGFQEEEWGKSVETAIATLQRVSSLYRQTGADLDERGLAFLKQDFYEVGSAVGTVLLIKKRYKDKKEQLREALQRPVSPAQGDPVLGNEIWTIFSSWARYMSNDRTVSPVVNLLGAGLGLGVAALELRWYRDKRGPQALPNYSPDLLLQGLRPKNVEIEAPDPELAKEIMDLLEKYRLNRVVPHLYISDTGDPKGAGSGVFYYNDRTIETFFGEGDLESFHRYPQWWKLLIFHELGHAVCRSVSFLQKDSTIFRHRVGLEKVLEYFRPRSLQRYFQPNGRCASLRDESKTDTANKDEMARNINEATLIDYAADSFMPMYIFDVRNFLSSLAHIKKPVNTDDFPSGEGYESFSAYFEILQEWCKGKTLSPIQKAVIDRIAENPELFDAKERWFYQDEWYLDRRQYFINFVRPHVLIDIGRREPERLEALVKAELGDSVSWEQAKHLVFSLMEDVRKTDSEFVDNELFAEVFQSYLRKDDAGVVNEIPERIWRDVGEVVNGILEDLIAEGLAKARGKSVV